MGIYYELALNYVDEDEDRTYISPERQLLNRLADLEFALEYIENNKDYTEDLLNDFALTEENLRYTNVEDFYSVNSIKSAIDLAIQDLKIKYNIDVEKMISEKEKYDENQIGLIKINPVFQLAS